MLHNNPNATDSRTPLVLSARLLAAADWGRYVRPRLGGDRGAWKG